MLGRQDLVPITGCRLHALHQGLAPEICCEADRHAAKRRGNYRAGAFGPRERAAVAAIARAAATAATSAIACAAAIPG